MFSSFSNSGFGLRYFKAVSNGDGGGGGEIPYIPHPFDELHILSRNDIIFDTINEATSSAFITDYQFGYDETTIVSGEFKVTASASHNNYRVGYAFNTSFNTWAAEGGYDGTTYQYNGGITTSASGSDYTGHWLQIECPMAFILRYMSYSHLNAVKEIWMHGVAIVASNDGIDWNYLTTIDAPTLQDTNTKSQLSGNTTAYKFYRFIVTHAGGNSNAYLSSVTMKTYNPVVYNTDFSLPTLREGNICRDHWIGLGNYNKGFDGWNFPTTYYGVQRYNNLELSKSKCFYTYEGLNQKYTVRFLSERGDIQKAISQNTSFTTGTYTVGIKVTASRKGYANDHKIYIKIGGVDVFPDGIGFPDIGMYPTTQGWINPRNTSFDIPSDGDRTIEVWSVRGMGLELGSQSFLYIAELVVFKNLT